MKRILIACEFSGTVRDAFTKRGFDAWSCDLLPSETPGNHIQGDVLSVLNEGWDLVIGHPPCTYLSYAATKYWNDEGREEKRRDAFDFFMKIYNAPCEMVAVENPVGLPNTIFRKPDQIIEPYFFGDNHRKKTCLWLRGLPKLIHVKQSDLFYVKTHIDPPNPIYIDKKTGKKRYFNDAISGSRNGGHLRSKTFQGIADAMAEQWGDFILQNRPVYYQMSLI